MSVDLRAFCVIDNMQPQFATESLLDLCAEKLGMDPFEMRRINAMKKGDFLITDRIEPGTIAARERGVFVVGVTNNYFPFYKSMSTVSLLTTALSQLLHVGLESESSARPHTSQKPTSSRVNMMQSVEGR